ncbi:MAG: carboxypeptidase regulatory-like domain-containing protein [Pyrinomonadaceae bacterium]|nr:carboxypeptidase regulatory-like domain-containing protein [Pyrinomonadaceae bacterium]
MQASPALAPISKHLRRSCAALFLLFICIIATASLTRAQDTSTTSSTSTQVVVEQQEKPQPTPEAPAKSIVRGRVIYEDSNRPVRRARVLLLRTDGGGGPEKGGATNERGEFTVKDVPAGSYVVMIDAPGIITPLSSIALEDGMDEKSAFVSIRKEFEEVSVNGTNRVDVLIRARRGGVITGRVTYQDGDPATGAQIIILRKKDNRLVRIITGLSASSLTGLRTDDRGIYRISGLPPGEYVLGASEANTRDDARDEYAMAGLFGSTSLIVSYYQNETSLKQATPIKVEAGREMGDINVTLIERATYTISGTVVARQGRRPLRAQVSIQSKSEANAMAFMDSGPTTTSDEQGRWSFTGIPDGTYVIKADPGTSETEMEVQEMMKEAQRNSDSAPATVTVPTPRGPSLVPRQQDVTVSGSDVSGVVIELNEGGVLRGTVTVEGSDKQLPPSLNLYLLPREGGLTGIERYGFIRPDSGFVIDKIPAGEYYVSVQGLGDKFYVKAITAGGSDLLREPVRIGQGTSIENVHVTIASDVATLQVRVVSASDAKPVRGAILLLVPADPARWRSINSLLPGVTDADGTFKFTAAPGSYLLMLVGEGDNLRAINEAFIRSRSASAKAVTLAPNARETAELVAPASGP